MGSVACAVAVVNLPAGQTGKHADKALAPVYGLYVPAGHGCWLLAFVPTKAPWGQ